jgi:hypothetical protein
MGPEDLESDRNSIFRAVTNGSFFTGPSFSVTIRFYDEHAGHGVITPNLINIGYRYDPAPGIPSAFGPFISFSSAVLSARSTVLLDSLHR